MGANFDGEQSTGVILGELDQTWPGIWNGRFGENVSILVSDADVVFLIAEVDADNRSELLGLMFVFHDELEVTRARSQTAGAASTNNLLILSPLEDKALELCSERVLDVGSISTLNPWRYWPGTRAGNRSGSSRRRTDIFFAA